MLQSDHELLITVVKWCSKKQYCTDCTKYFNYMYVVTKLFSPI